MIEHLPLVLAGAFAGGFTLGLTGFGNGLAAYGLWLHVLAPQIAAPLVAVGSVVGHVVMYRGFRHAIYPSRILPFVIGGLAGVPIGTWLLTIISVSHFKLFGGALLAGYSALSLIGGLQVKLKGENRLLDVIVGLFGGVCGGLASLSGPLLTIWCGLKDWSRDEQRGTYQPYNFAMLSMAIVAFGIAGLLTRELLVLVMVTLPATMVGIRLGRYFYGWINDAQFKRIILALLTISGVSLVWTSIVA